MVSAITLGAYDGGDDSSLATAAITSDPWKEIQHSSSRLYVTRSCAIYESHTDEPLDSADEKSGLSSKRNAS